MDVERISGTWKVVQSTDPGIAKGVSVVFAVVREGLEVQVQGAATYEIPWSAASASVASNGQTVIDTGHGTLWADPGPGADPAQFAALVRASQGAAPAPSGHRTFPAGEGRLIVLYRGNDDGDEVDPADLLTAIAADAQGRSIEGWHLASMVALPLRHAGQKLFGMEGSGYTTKAAIGCLYVRVEAPAT